MRALSWGVLVRHFGGLVVCRMDFCAGVRWVSAFRCNNLQWLVSKVSYGLVYGLLVILRELVWEDGTWWIL